MLGWEFPPNNVGGLGVACHGLAKSLTKVGNQLKIIIPKTPSRNENGMEVISAHDHNASPIFNEEFEKIEIDANLTPYQNSEQYDLDLSDFNTNKLYGKNLILEVFRFANRVTRIARKSDFDIIHAHDWMTFPAAVKAKRATGKPFVIHIHNTAFDRSGGNPNPSEFLVEKKGFNSADRIIAISDYVKKTLVSKYDIPPGKINVVHNGIDHEEYTVVDQKSTMQEKIVLFAGRVTLQKGPDYFVHAAKRVLEKRPDTKFVVAGSGDMFDQVLTLAGNLGILDKFIFTGQYSKEEGQRLMNMSDVFVMPSVSEPFGLVPLEAMIQKTPTIISKQSGVSEVLQNTLKVDFWDTDQLASKIVSVLEHSPLHEQLQEYGETEVKNISWDTAAEKCHEIFKEVKNGSN